MFSVSALVPPIALAPAHAVLPWVHRVFANAKRWALGVYHGLRPAHLQAGPWPRAGEPDPGLDEYVFRFNRRTARSISHGFARLVEQAVRTKPATYRAVVAATSSA